MMTMMMQQHQVLNASYAILHIHQKVVPGEEEGNGSGRNLSSQKT